MSTNARAASRWLASVLSLESDRGIVDTLPAERDEAHPAAVTDKSKETESARIERRVIAR
jgi:hypothetical protein